MSYDVTEIYAGGPKPLRVIRQCNHDERVIPVESVIGGDVVTVARLCLDCDTQLDVEPTPVWEGK